MVIQGLEFKDEADGFYSRYKKATDPQDIDRFYQRTNNRDIKSQISLALAAAFAVNGLRLILTSGPEKSFGVKVERYEDYDHDGTVFGRPEQVEMDVIIHNGTLILCEIKSSMSKSDLYAFWRKKNFYEDKHGRKATRTLVISPMIADAARTAAESLDIEVYGYAEDVTI